MRSDINTKWKQIGDCLFKTLDFCGIGGNENSVLDLEENTALWKGGEYCNVGTQQEMSLKSRNRGLAVNDGYFTASETP
ncbi:hypothetical protein EK904_002462 [Melospiza melodia maxima]|nr:hypothetical protein EK904_002462 [Melospiza melodia maxima]